MSASESRRPRIGLTTYLETAAWGVWNRPAALVPAVYLDGVRDAGGVPLLLPPGASDDGVGDILGLLDGLVLIGGADVDPALYGAQQHPATTSLRPDRDSHELRLLEAALQRDLPLLAICRGAQLLTVALGGTLHQHLPDVLSHEGHRPEPGVFGTTEITTAPGSMAAGILGDQAVVPCYHHQGLADIPSPLVPTAWADDGLVEAVEVPGKTMALGIQWHPEERAEDRRLFQALVNASRS